MTILNALLLAAIGLTAVSASAETLVEGFDRPPLSARPHAWWHWMNGHVTREGIAADLKAMGAAGLGGVTLIDACPWMPRGPLAYNSPEWFEMVAFACQEAAKNGLEVTLPPCSGWSSAGGPWNPPENGMKVLCHTEVEVAGPCEAAVRLPELPNPHGFARDIAVFAFKVPASDGETMEKAGVQVSSPAKYVRVLAFPEPFAADGFFFRLAYPFVWANGGTVTVETSDDGVAYRTLYTGDAALAWRGGTDYAERYRPFAREVKSRFYRVSFDFCGNDKVEVASLSVGRRASLSFLCDKIFSKRGEIEPDTLPKQADQVVAPADIVDLTDRMAADGSLRWQAPAGTWRIVRLGYAANGRVNAPASDGAAGFEVDKLSRKALDYHFDQYVKRAAACGVSAILTDSYEVGCQNWTDGFEAEFARRRGYSMAGHYPVLLGTLVGSVGESERFLADFRRTIVELFTENYAKALAENCHKYGLKHELQPYGNGPFDDFEYGAFADVPMAEFWSWCGRGERETDVGTAKLASSIAHVWGRRYCSAEAFTANPELGNGKWQTTPYSIKAQGDRAFATGINRLTFHRFTHQPYAGPGRLPGFTMGHWGMHFDRTQTWWGFCETWLNYLSRCQWLLQEGSPCADVLFWHGEWAPSREGHIRGIPAPMTGHKVPRGYGYNICPTSVFRALRVKDGQIVTPGGVSYALLALPAIDEISAEARVELERILAAGGRISSPRCPQDLREKGVLTGEVADAVRTLALAPDFICCRAAENLEGETAWFHRRYSDGSDAYFVAVPNKEAGEFVCSFRQSGRRPELWDPESQRHGLAPKAWRRVGDRTEVTFDLPPSGSVFVFFRVPTTETSGCAAKVTERDLGALTGPWRVEFPVDWYAGGTAVKSIRLEKPVDWTTLQDDDLRYFSGTATYVYEGDKADLAGKTVDFGEVKDFLEVWVNGSRVAQLWKPPFRVTLPSDPVGSLVVKVTNLWPNRLIGDDRLFAEDAPWDYTWQKTTKKGYKLIPLKAIPDWVMRGETSPTGRHTFTTWRHWSKEDDLLPSGILGPVTLKTPLL